MFFFFISNWIRMFWLNAAILMSVSVQKLLAPVLVALVFAVFTWDYMRSVSTFTIQLSTLLHNQLILPLCALYKTIIPICKAFYPDLIKFATWFCKICCFIYLDSFANVTLHLPLLPMLFLDVNYRKPQVLQGVPYQEEGMEKYF